MHNSVILCVYFDLNGFYLLETSTVVFNLLGRCLSWSVSLQIRPDDEPLPASIFQIQIKKPF